MDSNFWYRGTKARDFRNIPGMAEGFSTDEGDFGSGLRRRRQLTPVSLLLLSETR